MKAETIGTIIAAVVGIAAVMGLLWTILAYVWKAIVSTNWRSRK